MTERERLEQERDALDEQLVEARAEVDRIERERARVHDAIGALIGAPAWLVDAVYDCQNPGTCGVCHQCQRPQPCPAHAPAGRDTCPDGQLPDGPTCPLCGGPRAPSAGGPIGSGGWSGSWVHFGAPEPGL